jgi:probable HAF family extracellular repeat protein
MIRPAAVVYVRKSKVRTWISMFLAAVVLSISAEQAQASTFTFTDIGLGDFTEADGINDRGQVVGRYANGGFFRNADGTFGSTDVPGVGFQHPLGINNRDEIVGVVIDPAGETHGFLLTNKKPFQPDLAIIDVPNSAATRAQGINDRGQIVGSYTDLAGGVHGFFDTHGTFQTIDAFNPGASDAYGINNRGQIVGRFVDNTGKTHGFLDSRGKFIQIDVPGARQTSATSINDLGVIGGWFEDQTGQIHGFLRYRDGAFIQVDVNFSNSFNTQIFGVNDKGEIVGLYRTPLEAEFGFLATPSPTPEPATLFLWGTMAAGMGLVRWRRRKRT